jgi:hypothetical protein
MQTRLVAGLRELACMLSTLSEFSGDNGRRRNPGEGRRGSLEVTSSEMRLAPSTGAQAPHGRRAVNQIVRTRFSVLPRQPPDAVCV